MQSQSVKTNMHQSNPLRPSLLWCDIWEDVFEKVLGEPQALAVRCLKAIQRSVPWILDDFCLARARVFAKQHDLRLGLGLVLVHSLEIVKVVSIHRENVVEVVQVFNVKLVEF